MCFLHSLYPFISHSLYLPSNKTVDSHLCNVCLSKNVSIARNAQSTMGRLLIVKKELDVGELCEEDFRIISRVLQWQNRILYDVLFWVSPFYSSS